MALIKVKTTVRPRNLVILAAAANVAHQINELDYVLVTSGDDSEHMRNSKHYSGEALDFRTKNLTKGQKKFLIDMMQNRLGFGYQLILEKEGQAGEHLHVEYDPK